MDEALSNRQTAAGAFLERLGRFMLRLGLLMAFTFLLVTGAVILARRALDVDTFARLRLERDGYGVDPPSVHLAIERCDTLALTRLKIAGVPLDVPDEDGTTPFQKALRADRLDLMRCLTDLGAAVDLAEIDGRSAEVWALERGALGMAEYIIENGGSANEEVRPGVPALVWAIREGRDEAFDLLLRMGASIQLGSEQGSPLAEAVLSGNAQAVERLLEAGAEAGDLSWGGNPLVVTAYTSGRKEFVPRLLGSGADPEERGAGDLSLLEAAFVEQDQALFEACVQRGARPSEARVHGRSLFEMACETNRPDWVDLLLRHGADASARGARTGEPLWWTELRAGRPEIAERLLATGADVNAPLADGRRPIDVAVENRDFRLMRYLFKRGATADHSLWGPLESGDHDVLRLLAAKAGDLDNPSSTGLTLLGHAVRAGDLTATALLLEYGATVSPEETPGGHTMLEWTIANRQPAMAELLVNRGADVNARIKHPVSAEFLGKFGDHGSLTYYLKNDSQLTPLMVAAGSGQLDMAQYLLGSGASRSRFTKYRVYPVTFAISAKDIPMAQLMLGREPETNGEHERKLVVSLDQQKVRFYKDGEVVHSTGCSTGKNGYRTPRGTFVITDKARLRYSTLYGSAMPFFMRLSGSAVGMHQGYCPGYPASHGCIRLPYTYAKKFFEITKIGDIVVVE